MGVLVGDCPVRDAPRYSHARELALALAKKNHGDSRAAQCSALIVYNDSAVVDA